ncbi:hypothetical protein A4A49_17842 [Nicotiana attenuata]|uniref:Uncharacterized protein n=1 Tax=Nicotiana attenuata TaxID=49451 RepID=A0A314L7H3_NICAT|nr:hypothetical protein A4A49_17842 [Nicotiana attenuata]
MNLLKPKKFNNSRRYSNKFDSKNLFEQQQYKRVGTASQIKTTNEPQTAPVKLETNSNSIEPNLFYTKLCPENP